MKRVIIAMAGVVLPVVLSACAGADPVALAQAVKVLNEGCERTVELSLDKSQPGDGSLKVTRACAPAAAAPAVDPAKP